IKIIIISVFIFNLQNKTCSSGTTNSNYKDPEYGYYDDVATFAFLPSVSIKTWNVEQSIQLYNMYT
ncbi:hypothetical protein L9F63_018829, partial [Diploptera punctata]